MTDTTTTTDTTLITPLYVTGLLTDTTAPAPAGVARIDIMFRAPDKNTPAPCKNRCVYVPALPSIDALIMLDGAQPAINSLLASAYADFIRPIVVPVPKGHKPAENLIRSSIEAGEVSAEQFIKFLATTGRRESILTKISINEYCLSFKDAALAMLAERGATGKAGEQVYAGACGALAKLAAPVPGINMDDAGRLVAFLAAIADLPASPVLDALLAKLDAIINPPSEASLLASLGF